MVQVFFPPPFAAGDFVFRFVFASAMERAR
jgi:hypothetical protein